MRFWGTVLPYSSFLLISNIDGLVTNSLSAIVSPADLIFAAILAVQIYATWRLRKQMAKEKAFSYRTKVIASLATLFIFFSGQFLRSRAILQWELANYNSEYNTLGKATLKRLNYQILAPSTSIDVNGIIVHSALIVKATYDLLNFEKDLSQSEIAEIENYISRPVRTNAADFSKINNEKNIILIIVESLNARVIGKKINGREITPVMNDLLRQNGTISTTTMQTQIKDGVSSDGQLMYNAGLLPLTTGVAAIMCTPNIELRNLNEQLGKKSSMAIFADDGESWNQIYCYKTYGFDRIYNCNNFRESAARIGADRAMFDFGIGMLTELSQPFFLELVTISMHVPFQDKGVKGFDWIYDDTTIQKTEADYLRMTAYFDAALGQFITDLKNLGLYDNSIIVVASDHCVATDINAKSNISPNSKDNAVVFLAANTGMTKRIEKEVGQIDVYPTVLEIAGVENPEFGGVGVSMLDSTRTSFENIEAAQRVSELILRGNYFGSK